MKKIKIETAAGHSTARITKFDSDESHGLKKKKKRKKSKFKIQDSEISTTTTDIKEEVSPDNINSHEDHKNIGRSGLSTLWLNYKPRSTTLIKTGTSWYEQIIKENPEELQIDPVTKKNLKQIAGRILQQDVDNYKKVEEKSSRKGDVKFRKTVYNVGTYRDKLAAYVLRCMDSPAHSLKHLNSIILMISPKAKDEFEEALSSVLELLNSTLLPDNRVARKFENHQFSCLLPLIASNREQAEKQLALWYYEDQLQYAYRKLISQLTQISSDTVDKTKIVGIRSMVTLVKSHPGQDVEIILEAVINKLGDPSRKVAAQTMYSLQHLLDNRSQLKGSVVTLVEILLYRPNVTTKTQYYCLCYLKDLIFKRSDYQLAAKLIKLYIGFFKACTKKGEVDTRMMGALLRGINRAFPFSRLQGEALHEQLETLYKLCHIVNFSIATQALQLIYQVVTSKDEDQVESRFYQCLYRQIQDPSFGSSSGNTAFLNLVFKAMMRDDSTERRQAFVKRLLQVAQYQNPHLMCGILFLVSEIMKEKTDMKEAIQTVLQTHIDCEDPTDDFETFEDAEEEDESDVKEIETFVNEGVASVKEQVEDMKEELEDSKEGLIDIAEEDAECKKPLEIPVAAPGISSWFHRANTNLIQTIRRKHYDPYLRNPQYCGAHYSPLWELLCLQGHYHPSVSVFAGKIVAGGVLDYSGDPLQDFTLMRFLDRFVYKNPKKETEPKENTAAAVLGSKAYYCPVGARGFAVNTEEFLTLKSDNVPEDQQFFHSYFTKFKAEKKEKDDDEGSVNDDEFDDYLSQLGGAVSDKSDVDEDLDFAAGVSGPTKGGEEVMGSDEDDNASADDEPVFGGHSDESGDEPEFDGEDDADFDEGNIAFSDDDDDNFDSPSPAKKGRSKKQSQKKSKGKSLDSMFASADDFAHLLEENADEDTGLPSTTSKALANKDRAHAKQLHWEVDRNDKIKESGRYGNRGSWKKKRGQSKPGGQRHSKSSAGGPRKNFKSARGRGSFKSKRGRK